MRIIEQNAIADWMLQVVYVLTSTDSDPFLEQFYLSVKSLRCHGNEYTKVVLLTDELTYATCQEGIRATMIGMANEVIVADLDASLSGKVRSRLLKVQLREVVKGDCLYIDTDTLICDNIEQHIDYLNQFNVGAVFDQNIEWTEMPQIVKDNISQRVGGIFPDYADVREAYNGGVMWSKDCSEAREIYKLWKELYLFSERGGCSFDQPALEMTQMRLGYIKPLDGGWNVQGAYGIRYYSRAKIFHYYCVGYPEPKHVLRDNDFLKSLVAAYLRGDECDRVERLISDFMNGYSDRLMLGRWEEAPAYTSPMYWAIKGTRGKRLGGFIDRLGVLFNKLIKR